MKTLTMNEAQLISGGCPTCLVVPGSCVVAGVVTAGASYYLGTTLGYVGGAILTLGGAYLVYQKFEEKGYDIFS